MGGGETEGERRREKEKILYLRSIIIGREEFNNRCEQTEERTSELEDKLILIPQSWEQKNEQSLRNSRDTTSI